MSRLIVCWFLALFGVLLFGILGVVFRDTWIFPWCIVGIQVLSFPSWLRQTWNQMRRDWDNCDRFMQRLHQIRVNNVPIITTTIQPPMATQGMRKNKQFT